LLYVSIDPPMFIKIKFLFLIFPQDDIRVKVKLNFKCNTGSFTKLCFTYYLATGAQFTQIIHVLVFRIQILIQCFIANI
jgi:hypothetical protein